MSSVQQKRRKVRLFSEDPYCYWCGRKLRWPNKAITLDPDHATLDHLRYADEKTRTVLACHECNQLRAKKGR